jgi:Acetyltransferase (GNAT) domain
VRSLVPPDPPLGDHGVRLRPSRAGDAPAIRAVYSEPDIRKWMGWSDEPPDDAEAQANVDRAEQGWRDGTWAVFRIVDAATDEVPRLRHRRGLVLPPRLGARMRPR